MSAIAPSLSIVRVASWNEFPWLWHGFSTRLGGVSSAYQLPEKQRSPNLKGDLNLAWTKEDVPASVVENRRRFAVEVTGRAEEFVPLITLRQVHSGRSLIVPREPAAALPAFFCEEGRALLEADGLMTDAASLLLGIQTADCVPVLVADTRRRVVAGFHAGWRGTAAKIVGCGIEQMKSAYGSRSGDLIAAIGPSIGACCYSVGEAVYDEFRNAFPYGEALFDRRPEDEPDPSQNRLYLDLWQANRRQLVDAGVAPSRIETIGDCTGCAGLPGRRRYFSHRRENGFTGRMLSVIGVAVHPSGEAK